MATTNMETIRIGDGDPLLRRAVPRAPRRKDHRRTNPVGPEFMAPPSRGDAALAA
jgi:hypothetical protein